MGKTRFFIGVFLILITSCVMAKPIAVLAHHADYRNNHNQPNPKSIPESLVDLTDPYFYAPVAVAVIILAVFVSFLAFRGKDKPNL